MQSSKEGIDAAKSGSFKDDKEWGKACFDDLDKRRMGRPATRSWSTDFLLREKSSKEEIGKWLRNKSILCMATAEEAAPSSDWHFSVWTADGEVSLQKHSGVYTV